MTAIFGAGKVSCLINARGEVEPPAPVTGPQRFIKTIVVDNTSAVPSMLCPAKPGAGHKHGAVPVALSRNEESRTVGRRRAAFIAGPPFSRSSR